MRWIGVIGTDPGLEAVVSRSFEDGSVRSFESPDKLTTPPGDNIDFVFADIGVLAPPDESAALRTSLRKIREHTNGARIVVTAPPERARDAIQSVGLGADFYLITPVSVAEVTFVRRRLVELERVRGELEYLRGRTWRSATMDAPQPRSAAMMAVLDQIKQVAETDSTVLLTGETGTGKSLVARWIHRMSPRAQRPFISVHVGALVESLQESELFGHEKGAFTGAVKRKPGKFELAHGGTIFLDEVGTASPTLQIKLLQVLQERSFTRVGGEVEVAVDVRVVAATNADLHAQIEAGTFREDLFFRLNVFPIRVPPLRERLEDLPGLVAHFIQRCNARQPKQIDGVSSEVMSAFQAYSWPGNVRELESLIERAHILETGNQLEVSSFPGELFGKPGALQRSTEPGADAVDTSRTLASWRKSASDRAERQYLVAQLEANRGRIDATAAAAGITTRQLHKLMTRHGLRKDDFK